MPFFSVDHVRLRGIAASLPEKKVSNRETGLFNEKEANLLIQTTGIEFRRIAGPEMTAADLCLAAAKKLLDELNWKPAEVEVLLFVTQTPDYTVPGNSMIVQEALGIPDSCMCYDIIQGCAGFVYGLASLSSILSAGKLRKGLLLTGDTISHTIAPADKALLPVFSDAGSALALESDSSAPQMHFSLNTRGAGRQAIHIPHGGARQPVTDKSLKTEVDEGGSERAPVHLHMNGLDVFNFGLNEVAADALKILSITGSTVEEIDYFVMHQANRLLNESIRRKTGIPAQKVPYSLGKSGNTSCASIPVTMVSEISTESKTRKLNLLLSGFGAGLSWGSAIVRTNKLVVPGMIEMGE